MHNAKENNQPQLLINGGDKTYQVMLGELSDFLNTCKTKLGLASGRDIDDELQEIIESVITGTPDGEQACKLKRHLLFLNQLDLLFKGMLYEQV